MTTESILQILGIVFAAGIFYAKMEHISQDIKRLEQAQRKYNDLQARCHTLELWRQFHEKEHGVKK